MSDRRKITLTHEGWYYLLIVAFIVVGAVWRQVNLMIVLAGLMVGPLLLSWRICAATIRHLRVRRHMPDCVHAGEVFGVEIGVLNTRRRMNSWFIGVKDHIGYVGGNPRTHSADVEVLLPQIPAGDLSKTNYQCSLPLRGSYQFGPMVLFTRFPLGLLRCSRNIEDVETLIAFPRLGRLTKRWHELIQSRQAGLRRSLNRRVLTEGGDFYGVRDWQSGDSRRLIHWRMTAKLGQLAVRQFEQLDSFDLTLVLDLWQGDEEDSELTDLVEVAVSFAATAVHELCRQSGTRLRVLILGNEVWQLRGLATPRLRLQVLQELASRVSSRDYDANSQLQSLAAMHQRFEKVVVISTRSSNQTGVTLPRGDRPQAMAFRPSWLFVGDDQLDQYFQLPLQETEPFESVPAFETKNKRSRHGRPKFSIGQRHFD